MIEIDYNTFFNVRELSLKDFPQAPVHFVKATATINYDRRTWVIHNLKGRFYIISGRPWLAKNIISRTHEIYFEDPREATMYDLRYT